MIKILVAALAVGAVTTGTAPAHAEHAPFECDFTASGPNGHPDSMAGAAYGVIASATPGEAVSLQCWIRVDGVRVAETPVATGTNVAVAAGPIWYLNSHTDDVARCADWSAGAESGTVCIPLSPLEIPPR